MNVITSLIGTTRPTKPMRIGPPVSRGVGGTAAAIKASTSTPLATIEIFAGAAPSSSCFLRLTSDSVTMLSARSYAICDIRAKKVDHSWRS